MGGRGNRRGSAGKGGSRGGGGGKGGMADRLRNAFRESSADISSEMSDSILNGVNAGTSRRTSNETQSLAAQVAELLIPKLTASVEKVVKDTMTKTFEEMISIVEEEHTRMAERMEQQCLMLRYECDRQEQYSRRETVKISGLPEEDNEDVEKKVMDLCRAVGSEMEPKDISVMHRNGPKRRDGAPRPVLVRFTSRRSKGALMKKRLDLKDMAGYGRVYINDDLTPLRSKLLWLIKTSVPAVEKTSTTHDGKIRCVMKNVTGRDGERARVEFVENPDDLFNLGYTPTRSDFEKLGLSHFLVAEASA